MKPISKPARKIINNLISRTRKLIQGKTVLVEVHEYGVILEAELSWVELENAYLDNWEISRPMPDTTDREKKLISLIEDCYEFGSIFEKVIMKSKVFKDFQLEIKQLC